MIAERKKLSEQRIIAFEKRKKGDEKIRNQDLMALNKEAEEKRKRVKDDFERSDRLAFNAYKEAVVKKHKDADAERKAWLNTVKIKAREDLKKLAEIKEETR